MDFKIITNTGSSIERHNWHIILRQQMLKHWMTISTLKNVDDSYEDVIPLGWEGTTEDVENY